MNDLHRRVNEDQHLVEIDAIQQHLNTIQSTISNQTKLLLELIQREFAHFTIAISRELQYLQEKVVREVDNTRVNLELTARVLAEPSELKSIMQDVVELKDSIQDKNMIAKTHQAVQKFLVSLMGFLEVKIVALGETLRGVELRIHELNNLGRGVEVQQWLSIEQQNISSDFAQLTDVIKTQFRVLHSELSSEIQGTGNNLMYRLQILTDNILRVSAVLSRGKSSIFTQKLIGLITTAEHIIPAMHYEKDVLYKKVQKTANKLEDWILNRSADPIVNGRIYYSKAPVMPDSWVTCHTYYEGFGNLGFLACYAVDNLDLNISVNDHQIIDLATIINPKIFNSAVAAYLKLRRQYPDCIIDDENASKLNLIIERAQNTLAFISNIQSNALFVKLFQNHIKAITKAQNAFNEFLVEFNSDLDAELRQRQDSTEIQIINIFNPIQTIFASFADRIFKYPYRGDTVELRDISLYVVNKRMDFIRRLKNKDCVKFNIALEELSMTVNAIKVYAAIAGVPEDLLQALAELCTQKTVERQLQEFLDATTINTPLLQMPTEATINTTRVQMLRWIDRAHSDAVVLSTPLQQLLQHIIDETGLVRTAFLEHIMANQLRAQMPQLVPAAAPENYAVILGVDLAEVLHDHNQTTSNLVNAIIDNNIRQVARVSANAEARLSAVVGIHAYTPLHIATYIGNQQIITALTENIVNKANARDIINAEDADGNTPLMLAAQRGHIQAVQHLCELSAELDHRNDANLTAQEIARVAGHAAIVLLIERILAARNVAAGSSVPGAGAYAQNCAVNDTHLVPIEAREEARVQVQSGIIL